jgi:hypothetical protein
MPLAPYVSVPQRDEAGRIVLGPDKKPIIGLAVNPVKNFVRGYWLDPALTQIPVTLAAQGAAGDSAVLNFLIDQQGHFDWAYILGVSTGEYSLDFFDGGTNRRLQNRPVPSTLIVGNANRPFRLPEPYFFNVGDSQREIQVTVRNLTAVTNTVRLILYGRRFYHKEAPPEISAEITRKFDKGWRTYSYFLVPLETDAQGDITPVGANATVTLTLESDDDADTSLQKLMASSTGAFTFQIRERATNRTLGNGPIHTQNGWGNAEFPFLFADTYLLERKKQLLVELTDISGAQNEIRLAAAGRRLQYR